jgi:hypothetical protein
MSTCAILAVVRYHEIFPMGRADLERLLESGNDDAIIDAQAFDFSITLQNGCAGMPQLV